VAVTLLHPDRPGVAATLPAAFRYVDTIAVSAVEPVSGLVDGGIPVTVRGRGFTPDTRVFFAGRPALTQRVVDTETVTGVLPPGVFGAADVHAVGLNGTAELADAFFYGAAPTLERLDPITGPAAGGTRVTLSGSGLGPESVVSFGDRPAEVVEASADGRRLLVESPAAAVPGAVVDVSVQTAWGSAVLTNAFGNPGPDPYVLACSHLVPAAGELAGGDLVEIACTGLVYGDVAVTFGGQPAAVVEVLADHRVRVRAPLAAAPGVVPVAVRTAAAGPVQAGTYTYRAPAPVAIDAVTPAVGDAAGGTHIAVSGRGFARGASLYVGALPATSVTVAADGTRIDATTAPGVPGPADIVVRQSAIEHRKVGAFEYVSGQLELGLATPPSAARSGGTYMRLYGAGFGPATTVQVGGVDAPIIARVSSAELHVRSPKLEVGVHDVVVRDGTREARLERALIAFDPRSGSGGTWGGPIDESLNVTVWGTNGYGPVAGAFVLVGNDPSGPLRGITDENGQVTLSEPGLVGPLEVTASRDGFTAYSVIVFDAKNVTVSLTQNPVPPQQGGGGGGGYTPPPNATISGKVLGFDKYVIAPPGSCAAKAIPETLHCANCDATAFDGGCRGDSAFACVDVGNEGTHCLSACATNADCQAGYACGATIAGARCVPSLGVKRAYCNVSSTSLFGYEYPIQPSGWVDAEARYVIDSRRLGELAIYCFGGYQDLQGIFTPTVMGIRRNFFAHPSAIVDNVDIELAYPLERSFRFKLQDPPTWSTGLNPPSVVVSLDLGADGVVPFSRNLVQTGVSSGPEPTGGELWVAPRQLTKLAGEIYDAHYFLYTTLSPAGVSGSQPRSFNLIQYVQSIVEDRLPLRDASGWRLEGAQIQRDLRALWEAPRDGEQLRLWAVGEAGTILLWNGAGWTMQSRPTEKTLTSLSGTAADDVWAAGEASTLIHFDGLGWRSVAAPADDYEALLATPEVLFVAGKVRLRKFDRTAAPEVAWSLAGAPAVQGIRGLFMVGDRVVALGRGCAFERQPDDSWRTLQLGDIGALRAGLVRKDGSLVVVGDGGVLLSAATLDGLQEASARKAVPTRFDLTSVTEEADGTLVVVGDNGVVLRGKDPSALSFDPIPDYRSKAFAVRALSDGTTRVVGSAAYILGPFLHFPLVTAPLHEASVEAASGLAFAWTWDGGPDGQYTRLALTPDASITVWTLIVEGLVQQALLPNLNAAAGLAPLASGRYRLEVLRVLNRNFDIDSYTTRDFSLYVRDAWATNEAYFFIP
jgi:hypothetical protein